MAGGKFVVSGGKRMLESEERPKKKLKVAKGGKKAKGEEEDSEPKFESMKEHMVPIQYKESASDNFKWEDVPIDAKMFGNDADMSGLMGIQFLSEAESEKYDRAYNKQKNKQKEVEKGSVKGFGKKSEAEPEPAEKKKKKKNNPPSSERRAAKMGGKQAAAKDGEDDEVEDAGAVGGEAGKKKKKKRKRKGKGKAEEEEVEEGRPFRIEDLGLVKGSDDEEEEEEQEGEEGGGDGGEGEGEEEAVINPADDPDDEWEYSEWGGIMLRKCVVRAIEDLGFDSPTPIQAQVLPIAMSKRCDIFGAAETGSGKTLAFALPMLQRILESHSFSGIDFQDRKLAGLCVLPTRELAIQVRDHIKAVAKYTKIHCVGIVGGLSIEKQERQLAMRPHIVVGTPGRLWELMQKGDGYLSDLKMLLCFVIDEADRMLETGHFADLESILKVLPRLDPKGARRKQSKKGKEEEEESEFSGEEEEEEVDTFLSTKKGGGGGTGDQRHYRRQTMVFSATLIKDSAWRKDRFKDKKKKKKGEKKKPAPKEPTTPEEIRAASVEKIVERLELVGEPAIVDVTPSGKVSHKIEQCKINTMASTAKDVHVYHLLLKHLSSGGGRSIVFVNAIGEARRLAAILVLLRVRAVLLHSSLQQRQRLRNMDIFKGDKNACLIATDIAARGLDLPDIQLVLHYHVPKVPSIYVHRCGRSGRGKAEGGKSVLLVSPQEAISHQKIVDMLGEDVPEIHDEGPHYAAAEKRWVAAKKLEAELNKHNKDARHKSWMKLQAEAMDIDLSDDDENAWDEDEVGANVKRGKGGRPVAVEDKKVAQMRDALNRLLDSAVLPVGVSPRFITARGATSGMLPEMLTHGSTGGSSYKYAGGDRVHRKKNHNPRKFGKR